VRRRLVPWSVGLGAFAAWAGATVIIAATATVGASTLTASALTTLQAQLAQANATVLLPSTTDPKLAPLLAKSGFGIPAMINRCTPTTNAVTVPTCVFGDVSSPTTVVLYGNSQAQSWAPALARLGHEDHFRLIPIAKPACGSFVDNGYLGPPGRLNAICSEFDQRSIARINALRPALVVIASTPGSVLRPGTNPHRFHYNERVPASLIVSASPGRTARDFVQFVRDIAPSHARVVLLGDIPITFANPVESQSPTDCLLAHPNDTPACAMVPPTPTTNEWDAAFVKAASAADVPYIDVSSLLCVQGRCPLVVGDVLVDFDHLHVSGPYATLAANALGDLLANQLP
jgi:hypothetical protein